MPDIPLRLDADPQWQAIHAAADAQQGALARLVYSLFVGLTARRVLAGLRAAIRASDIERAVASVPVDTILEAAPAVEAILLRAATGGAAVALARRTKASPTITLPELRTLEAEIGLALGARGLLAAELVNWSRTHAAELVTGLTNETRRALRNVLTQAMHQGQSPARTARLVESIIGLTRPQSLAVARYSAALREAGTPVLRLNMLTQRYADRLVRQRALMVARTEALTAANEGRRAQWAREVSEGLIDRNRWEREWVAIVPSDGKTCPYCEEQDEQRAPIGGTYPDGSSGPPGHPICRCTEKLVRSEGVPVEPAAATDEELAALDRYTQSHYGQINTALREGEMHDLVSPLDALAAKRPTTEPMTVYRGVGQGNVVASLDVDELRRLTGTVIEERAFVSTSLDPAQAVEFTTSATPLVLEIQVPVGTRAIDVTRELAERLAADAAAGRVPSAAAREQEIILARGYRFRVVGVVENAYPSRFYGRPGLNKLILELIP